MKHNLFRISGRLLVLMVFVLFIFVAFFKAYDIRDYVKLHNYDPPARIAKLADDTTMTDRGKRLFYVNRPVLADREEFTRSCSGYGEKTIVLGCYHSGDRGIFLFDVSDDRLDGVEQVTAAHEMLHAAYERLGTRQRQDIDARLNAFYAAHTPSDRLKETIAGYQESVPEDLSNEMHSIFATEIATLPDELEDYYRDYFHDRKRVVQIAEQYQLEFTARREKVKTFDERLSVLKQKMDANTASLERRESEITEQRALMEQHRSSGNFEAYNSMVSGFNASIARYNERIGAARTLVADYNRIVGERNAIALEVKQLAGSIDSRHQTIE